jgi:tetratricopeptide (TPR) repeat protein
MRVLALFEDGTTSKLLMEFYDPNTKAITVDVIGQRDQAILKSAEDGCHSAYNILRELKVINEGKKYYVSFEFDGQNNVMDYSAGLTFSLKFTAEAYLDKKNKSYAFSLAATGCVSDITKEAKVTKVEGFEKKLKAAIDNLHENDLMFYPQKNEEELDESLREEAKRKGIKLIPVSTVREAVERLLEVFERDSVSEEKHTTEDKKVWHLKLPKVSARQWVKIGFWGCGIFLSLLVLLFAIFGLQSLNELGHIDGSIKAQIPSIASKLRLTIDGKDFKSKRIAFLPFRNLTGYPALDSLTEELPEALQEKLPKEISIIGQKMVKQRIIAWKTDETNRGIFELIGDFENQKTQEERYFLTKLDPICAQLLGRKLDVDLVIVGNLERDLDKIRIELNAIDTYSGKEFFHWAGEKNHVKTHILKSFPERLRNLISQRSNPRADADEAYRTAGAVGEFNRSIAIYKEAVRKDPCDFKAYVGLFNAYFTRVYFEMSSGQSYLSSLRLAWQAFQKAKELKPDAKEVYRIKAQILFHLGFKGEALKQIGEMRRESNIVDPEDLVLFIQFLRSLSRGEAEHLFDTITGLYFDLFTTRENFSIESVQRQLSDVLKPSPEFSAAAYIEMGRWYFDMWTRAQKSGEENKGGVDFLQKSKEMYEEAIDVSKSRRDLIDACNELGCLLWIKYGASLLNKDKEEPKRQRKEIIKLFEKAIRLNPKLVQSHIYLAEFYCYVGQRKKGEKNYKIAMSLCPTFLTPYSEVENKIDNPCIHNLLCMMDSKNQFILNHLGITAIKEAGKGTWLHQLSNDENIDNTELNKAIEWLGKAKEYDKSFPITRLNQAYIYHFGERDYEKAKVEYDEVIRIWPKFPRTYVLLGQLYIELAQRTEEKSKFYFEKAEDTLQKTPRLGKYEYQEAEFLLGELYYSRDMYAEALKRYINALVLNPLYLEAWVGAAVSFDKIGKSHDASYLKKLMSYALAK